MRHCEGTQYYNTDRQRQHCHVAQHIATQRITPLLSSQKKLGTMNTMKDSKHRPIGSPFEASALCRWENAARRAYQLRTNIISLHLVVSQTIPMSRHSANPRPLSPGSPK